jgi:hypothetical protein
VTWFQLLAFTLQHTPRILCADVLDEVNVDEHPALADLGAGNLAGAGLLLQRHRMKVQKRGSGLQIERVHARILWACVAINPYRPK